MRRPRSRSDDDLDAVDVLLVDDDDEDVAADEFAALLHELALEAIAWRATWPGEERPPDDDVAVVDEAPAGLGRRLATRYRRHAVTAAVLAVAVAATTAVVDARQAGARAAALAATPAVLAEASSPPAEVWRLPGRVVTDLDDRLLVVDAASSLRAVDPGTGEVVWTASAAAGRAASTGDCFPVDESLGPYRAPVEPAAGPRGLLACVPTAPGGDPAQGDATAVVVVDTTTGQTVHTVTVDGGLLLAEPVGRDLLVTAALPDGRVRVTRWDLATGTPRWESVSPQPVLTGDSAAVADAVERRRGTLTVGTFAVDLTTGERLEVERARREPLRYQEHTLPGGARATWSWQGDGTSGRGYVGGGRASSSYSLPGPPLRPSVTDGSDAGVLLVRTARRDRLRGLDLRTGRMRWTQPYPGASTLRATALVEGVMLLDDGATVTALDLRTGTGIWRSPVDADATGGPALTDGEVVLLPVRSDGALHLVAHRIADGTVVWRGELPPGTVSMTVVDHHLLALTDDEVIGLR